MPKVLIADKMSPLAEEVFRKRGVEVEVKTGLPPAELKAIIGEYDGVAIRSASKLTAELLEAAGRLRVIGRAGIGVDNVDIPAASKRGIIVMNTPFGNSITTAEHAVAMMMAAARQIGAATASTKAGKWEKNRFMGVELYHKTVGVIGAGNIGALVVERCKALGMRVMVYDPFLSRQRAEEMGVEVAETPEDLWPTIDLLTLHTPLNAKTRHLVNADAFARMKKGVIIVNCARGGIVDEAALQAALDSGKVFAAALDVFEVEPAQEHPLFGYENVVLTPHLGASTKEAQVNVAVQVAEQIADYLLKGTIQNAVNIPSVSEQELPILRPYLNLADKLGTTLGQMATTGVKRIEVAYEGEVADLNRMPITTTILKSILAPMLDPGVNMVNAPVIAKERGIEMDVSTKPRAQRGFTSLITATVICDKRQRSVSGTLLYGEQPRLVEMDGIPIEAAPEGNMLFIANQDAPGLIGRVGSILGEAGINIANFHLGRDHVGGRAIAFINTDQEASQAVMDRLAQVTNVLEVRQIRY
ncbi:MAG: phosphoglycerate dehydrogenase [Magnetococcales bacterium]|nr:phosphoglycerate dehydrogenase [Magnetococcales bacterium]